VFVKHKLPNLMHTSVNSTSGGPSAISSAFVPFRILREAPWSTLLALSSFPWSSERALGDLGCMKSSESGGGLGSRGELEGDIAAAMVIRLL
jgi:hypothetical protein